MAAARITVSSVAFGPDADAALLRSIAKWGGGRDYVVEDAQQIPQIRKGSKERFDAGLGRPQRDRAGCAPERFLQRDWEYSIPSEHNPVTRRAGAVELLATSRHDPLLTMWPAGLGRTACSPQTSTDADPD
jgi:hypothetical protein